MDTVPLSLIPVILILVCLSAFFSATETAFSSLNRVRVKRLAEEGSARAAQTLQLLSGYDKLLSTILIGNNIVNITAASLGTVLFVRALGDTGATVSTAVITVVVLIFGEITPKSLAKESPEKFALFVTPVMRALVWGFTPLTFVFGKWKTLISRVFKKSEGPSITEAELMSLVEEAEHEGAIDQEDTQLIQSVIDFNDKRAEDILTPRVDIIAVPDDATTAEIRAMFEDTGFSRLPVYQESIDHIVGVIHLKNLHRLDRDEPLSKVLTPVVTVMPSLLIGELLRLLQKNKCHLAVVIDEYGGTEGIITLEDVLEELVGDIWDEHDDVVEPFQQTGEDSYTVMCGVEADRFFKFFDLPGEPEEATVSGWIMDTLGRIPEEGDEISVDGLHVRVTRVEHRRVLECQVERVREAAEGDGEE